MLLLTGPQASDLVWKQQFADAQLAPHPTTDGRYALPESVLTDRRFARFREQLRVGSIGSATLGAPLNETHFITTLGGAPAYVSAARVSHAFGMPATDVYRFECRKNESGYGGDSANRNRRSEIVADGAPWSAGATVWEAWSTVVSPSAHTGFDLPNAFAAAHQWHSVDTGMPRPPVLVIAFESGNIRIRTLSDASGSAVTHYNAPRPADGTAIAFVVQATPGAAGTGHLRVWINGTQVVNAATPIGYYNDDGGARALAYPHWGMYMTNVSTRDVIFHGRIEHGTADLSARIASPLALATPRDGWV